MNFADLLFIPLIFYAGHLIINRTVDLYEIESQRPMLIRLFYYHITFSLLFGWYVTIFGGDAGGYWNYFTRGQDWLDFHQPGTSFIRFIAYPFSQIFGLSYWAGTLLFSLFGFVGFIYVYLTIIKFTNVNPTLFGFKLFPAILFLPNMHFWSGGIGKDSVMFFALALFIFSMTNPARNVVGILFSLYLSYFVRPHIALLMLIGFVFGLLVSTRGVSVFWRVVFLVSSIYFITLVSPAVFEYIGLDEENIEAVEDIAKIRSTNLTWRPVRSAINIQDYSVGLKMFTFFFRPLFFDAGNVFGLLVSFENLYYLILAISMLRPSILSEMIRMPMHLKAGLFVLISTGFFMSSSLGNLGIIIRQKNMVMFIFIAIAVYLLAKNQEARLPHHIKTVHEPAPHGKTEIA